PCSFVTSVLASLPEQASESVTPGNTRGWPSAPTTETTPATEAVGACAKASEPPAVIEATTRRNARRVSPVMHHASASRLPRQRSRCLRHSQTFSSRTRVASAQERSLCLRAHSDARNVGRSSNQHQEPDGTPEQQAQLADEREGHAGCRSKIQSAGEQ